MSGVNCREFEAAVVELARRAPLGIVERARLVEHLDACEDCQAMLDRQVRLSAAAVALVERADMFTVPRSVEEALLREMETLHVFPRRRLVYGVVGGAIAASLAVFVWMMQPRVASKLTVVAHVSADHVSADSVIRPVIVPALEPVVKHSQRVLKPVAEPEQPFIAIPYTLPLEPYERADVMRMDLPVAALIAAGLPMNMADPAAMARADVLVGQDGRARAIRLVSVSASSRSSN
jgi:hypothetical protein